MEISEAHKEALDEIIKYAYPYGYSYDEVFENMIEIYLLRENGRMGTIVNGEYRKGI